MSVQHSLLIPTFDYARDAPINRALYSPFKKRDEQKKGQLLASEGANSSSAR